MKLTIGVSLVLAALALAGWQIRRYRERTTEAVLDDIADLVLGFAPNVLAVLLLVAIGATLIRAHFYSG